MEARVAGPKYTDSRNEGSWSNQTANCLNNAEMRIVKILRIS